MLRTIGLHFLTFAFALVQATVSVVIAQSTTRVSVSSAGLQGNDYSGSAHVSDDGNNVVFITNADNLIANGWSGSLQVYGHDRIAGITKLVSATPAGMPGNNQSYLSNQANVLSSSVDAVVFSSIANNLVAIDTNNSADVFLRDRLSNTTTLVSSNVAGVQGNWHSELAAISADGNFVAFQSVATNLVPNDQNLQQDVFVKDLTTGAVEVASRNVIGSLPNGPSHSPAISGDGRWVAYASDATNIVAGDSNGARDVFVYDRTTGVTERISVNTPGTAANGASDVPSISHDGSRIAFQSNASNLVPGDMNGVQDIFLRDRALVTTARVSVSGSGMEGNATAHGATISANGQYVAFYSSANNLFAGDTNGWHDAFRHDLNTGALDVLSLSSTGVLANHGSELPTLSAAGDVATFPSLAINLIATDANGARDIFVNDLSSTATPITSYCTAKASSGGCVARIGTSGIARISGSDSFRLCAGNLPEFAIGLFFYGKNSGAIPFHGGTLCVSPPLWRSPQSNAGTNQSLGACLGASAFALTASTLSSRGFGVGDIGYAQFWFRDGGFAPPDNMAMTDAVTFTIEP